MPNKQSAIKELRKNKKRAAHNVRIRKNVRALFKSASELLKAGKRDEAIVKMRAMQKAADKAAKEHVIHTNKARRMKAVIMSAMAKKA